MKTRTLLNGLLLAATALVATNANAIPAFARKYQTECSSCHTAYPALNRAGRKFKEAGYAFPKLKGEETISDFLHWDKVFPLSAVVVSRPFDKKNTGNAKIRAVHEIELLSAGRLYKNVSGFVELEAEDEDDFKPGFEHAAATYTFGDMAHAQVAWAPVLFADPYDTYSDMRRLTAAHLSPVDRGFGGADNGSGLRKSRQTLAVYGRPIERLFYDVGIGGVAEDTEGSKSRSYFGRLAFDATRDIMVGGLALGGTCEDNTCGTKRDFSRFAIDGQADVADFRFTGLFMWGKDDLASGTGDESNNAWYLQGLYTWKKDGRPVVVPLVRVDGWQENDGRDDFTAVTLNAAYYLTQNIKGFLEYYNNFDTPANVREESRVTLQFEMAF